MTGCPAYSVFNDTWFRVFGPLPYNHALFQAPKPIPGVTLVFYIIGHLLLKLSSNFIPTTKAQSVLVYALNVLLLVNLTVIVVLLLGVQTDPSLVTAATPHEQGQKEPVVEPVQPAIDASASASVQALPKDVVVLLPTDAVFEKPSETSHTPPPDLTGAILVSDPPALAPDPAPDLDEPPVQFFGVDIDN